MACKMIEKQSGMEVWINFTEDMNHYVGVDERPWSLSFCKRLIRQAYFHPGIFAVVVYRFGQWVQVGCKIPIIRQLCELFYCICFNWVRIHLQIEIPRAATIAGGLRIDHFGGIIINSEVIAGKNFYITNGVVVGHAVNGVPVIGDNVTLNIGAKLIGKITLGSHVIAGAGAVVTKSFPDYAVIAGVPAKLLRLQLVDTTVRDVQIKSAAPELENVVEHPIRRSAA